MDRRGFLLGLAGALGAGAAASATLAPAQATVLGQLKDFVPERSPDADLLPETRAGATPDGTAVEDAQYWGPPPGVRRRHRRRRRRVCGWRRNRWGRRIRTCWYVWR